MPSPSWVGWRRITTGIRLAGWPRSGWRPQRSRGWRGRCAPGCRDRSPPAWRPRHSAWSSTWATQAKDVRPIAELCAVQGPGSRREVDDGDRHGPLELHLAGADGAGEFLQHQANERKFRQRRRVDREGRQQRQDVGDPPVSCDAAPAGRPAASAKPIPRAPASCGPNPAAQLRGEARFDRGQESMPRVGTREGVSRRPARDLAQTSSANAAAVKPASSPVRPDRTFAAQAGSARRARADRHQVEFPRAPGDAAGCRGWRVAMPRPRTRPGSRRTGPPSPP